MYFPTLNEIAQSRQMMEEFLGYNHNPRIAAGEFYDMENMASDSYPMLAPRKERGAVRTITAPKGLAAKDCLIYADGGTLYYNGLTIPGFPTLSASTEKQFVSMGAYIAIFPDRVYLNTEDLTEFGYMDNGNTTSGTVTFTLCKIDGTEYSGTTASDTQPSNPANGALWIDTSGEIHTLKQYSANTSMWVQIATVYIKIGAAGIGAGFSKGDGVEISGCTAAGTDELNATMVIQDRGENYIVVIGILDAAATQVGAVTVQRRAPDMDFIVEAGNRLWGCYYGISGGKTVNELYCCKLGDFKNWRCYAGISTDAWAASVGSDGPWTGAVNHLGYPVFFKEGCYHKIYISSTGGHQVVTSNCRGVQKGSGKSLAVVNEVLYYKSVNEVCAFDGSGPASISSALGDVKYSAAVAGALGDKYYISMKNEQDEYSLFVYSTKTGQWHREDAVRVMFFTTLDSELYFIASDNRLYAELGSDGETEGNLKWRADTGEIGYSYPDHKYISRMTVRADMEQGSYIRVYMKYDGGDWRMKGTIEGDSIDSHVLPIRPRRCDHFALRFEGHGKAKIYNVTYVFEEGSDIG